MRIQKISEKKQSEITQFIEGALKRNGRKPTMVIVRVADGVLQLYEAIPEHERRNRGY